MLLSSLLILVGVCLILGLILGFASEKFKPKTNSVVEQINDILPQTQCGQCGHPGCRPYAQAMAVGEAINRCPPGGEAGIKALAQLLGKEIIPLDDDCGEEKAEQTTVVIREAECIGCTKCIQACPVDAIIGAPKQMHVIITDYCTGCDLCIPPCPVDCIDIVSEQISLSNWAWPEPK